ncbi:glycosyltransferase family 1 protein [Anaerobutyricum soehngenii]|uniref:Glycosyltransferase family 1 protein n=1 Tax=Anaerobutyricum soehngenii TaxID=105843 RepID=A0A6N7YDU2_9FIRM|nr:glycosyltransferase family 1 protein [Anaerobutyricum soehngenii]MSU82543.1 glycosyltransferase family 1 protein [Anaerobutyricum soehngenii]
MRKAKVVMITSYFDRNGVTSQVINYATNLDKNKFQVSIAAGEPYDIGYEKLCQENNIELCKLPKKQKNVYTYYRMIYSYLKKVKADIVHVHGSSALITIELLIAMLAGVPVRVSHSHNTICSHPVLHQILKPFLKVVSNCRLACGELAGKWMYGDDAFKIIPNAFETDTFVLNSETRLSIRKKLGVSDNLVIGHIGKFNYQKNQEYLIRAFEKLSYKDDKAILLLVGNGPDLEEIKNQAQHTACADRIIFWGATANPESLYSAMDIFALPSRFEGLPVVLLEAQISGLPCIVSDKVTREVDFGDIIWKSIEDDPQIWADTILSMGQRTEVQRKQYRLQHVKQIARYDIKESAKLVENIYECKLLKKK